MRDLLRACVDVGFLLRQALAEELAPYGVTPEQQEILALIEAGHVTARGLAEASGRDKTTVSRLLARAEKSGLVAQQPRSDDKRSKALHLTPRGATLLAQTTRLLDESSPKLLDALSPKDRRRLTKILARLRAGIVG